MSLPPAPVRIVHFGVFEADFQAGELRKAGIRVKLHDQSLQILAMLLEHPGALVTREEIKNKLWPRDTFVDFDHGLNNAVNRLRTAIGDAADSPRWIETLPRRGYRFIGPANQAERSSADIVVSDVPLGEDVRMDPATASRAEQVISRATKLPVVALGGSCRDGSRPVCPVWAKEAIRRSLEQIICVTARGYHSKPYRRRRRIGRFERRWDPACVCCGERKRVLSDMGAFIGKIES